jgi:hypothetical protein
MPKKIKDIGLGLYFIIQIFCVVLDHTHDPTKSHDGFKEFTFTFNARV